MPDLGRGSAAADDAAIGAFNLAVLAQSELAIFSVAGLDGFFRHVNPAFARLLDRPREEILQRSLIEFVVPQDIPRVLTGLNALADGAAETSFESRWLHRDGSMHWLAWVARRDPVGELWYGTARDVTGDRHTQEALEQIRERLTLALSVARAGSWEWNARDGRIAADPGTEALLCLQPGQLLVTLPDFLRCVDRRERRLVLDRLRRLDREDAHFEIAFQAAQPADAVRHLALRGRLVERSRHGQPMRATGILFDVTSQKNTEERLQNLALRDALTGVHNTRRLNEALAVEWQRAMRSGKPLSALMIDFDDFKAYNDTYGHAAGDEALRCVARTVEGTCMRPADLLARYGGEEFVVLLPETPASAAEAVAVRILEAIRSLALPHRVSSHGQVTVSIGVASMHAHAGSEPKALMLAADQAMYRAKHGGRNAVAH